MGFSRQEYWSGVPLLAQMCLTLCDPMDCSLPGSSVHGILQARILEWVVSPDLPDPEIKLAFPEAPAMQEMWV